MAFGPKRSLDDLSKISGLALNNRDEGGFLPILCARPPRKALLFFEILAEVMGRSIGCATISSPFSGAGALRVVYAPEIQGIFLGFPCISLRETRLKVVSATPGARSAGAPHWISLIAQLGRQRLGSKTTGSGERGLS